MFRFTIRDVLWLTVVVAMGFAGLIRVSHAAENPIGSWFALVKIGDTYQKMVTNLRLENGTLTGTITYPREDGIASLEFAISKGTFKDDEITFSVERKQANGKAYTQTYIGKISGDTINGKIHRSGHISSTDWKAERQK